MNTFTVLYRTPDLFADEEPFAFRCEADDVDHAEEQCGDAEPNADIVWVAQTGDVQVTFLNYYGVTDELIL